MVSPNEVPSQVPSTVTSVSKTTPADTANADTTATAGAVPASATSTLEKGSTEGCKVEPVGPAEAHTAHEQKKEEAEGSGTAAKGAEHQQQQPSQQSEKPATASTGSRSAERDPVQKGGKHKSGREEAEGEKFSGFRKRRKTDGGRNNSDFPKTRDEMSPDQLKQRIKRQVEYYLSDESLMFDQFFQSKMKEAAQQGVGEALEIGLVTASPRMQQLNISREEILAALEDSSSVKVKRTADGKIYLHRDAPLPELRERGSKRGGGGGSAWCQVPHGLGKDCHAVGCFLRVRNIPAEVTQWQQVKDAVRAAFPGDVLVRFVSNIEAAPADSNTNNNSSRRQCWVLLAPFEDDRATIEKQQPIKLYFSPPHQKGDKEAATAAAGEEPTAQAGTEAPYAEAILMHEKEVKRARSEMPARLRSNHERDVQQLRSQLAGLPLLLNKEVRFNSVDHLRKCVAEFLQKTAAGERLRPGGAAEKAVLALLDYHPKAFFKKGGRDKQVVGAKVGFHEKREAQGQQQKSFFVIRKNIETGEEDEEDFLVDKCIAELAKDPPCEPEALAQLLKTRNGLAAQKRSQAAAQAATRKRNREEAARVAAPSCASLPPAGTAAGAPCGEQQRQQQPDAPAATEAAKEQQPRIGETEASEARQQQPGEAATAAVTQEAAASCQQTGAAVQADPGDKEAAAESVAPTTAQSQSN